MFFGSATWYRGIVAVFVGIILLASFLVRPSESAPLLANYYLGTLPTDETSIGYLAKTHVLILSPEMAVTRRAVIDEIKRRNPDVIFLAYISSKSYNNAYKRYPGNTVFGDFTVRDDWWLRDSAGHPISHWNDLTSTNMSAEWSDYVIGFVKDRILSQGIWDGIFWDEVYDGASGLNGGNVDLNRDGVLDNPALLNAEWVRRINYFLEKSRRELPVKYIVTNGSSLLSMQGYINGRMYESFPTPWEAGGNWSGLMTKLQSNQGVNPGPHLYVFNANTNNSGNKTDYRRMRYGLASSLMVDDTYFSFDYGDQDHSQVWWYDEYDANLGDPVGPAEAENGGVRFTNDVWRRDYTNGLALVNATNNERTVDLGGEYEKLIGTQDRSVNDGSIVEQIKVPAKDGVLLFKTFRTVPGVPFKNGAFLRFYKLDGSRARNGFFAFEENQTGGTVLYNGDLDGDGAADKIVAEGPRLTIYNSHGDIWNDLFPFGGNFEGELRLAVGDVTLDGVPEILVSGSLGGQLILYTYYGEAIRDDLYPFGTRYQGGFSVAIGNVDGGSEAEAIVGTGTGRAGEVLVYDGQFRKLKKRFYPFETSYRGGITVAAGDFNGDGRTEIAAARVTTRTQMVRFFTGVGRRFAQFSIRGLFGIEAIALATLDVTFEGKQELVVMTNN